jgi:drug/metabolite transporter (DMT)-like permease
MTVDASAVRIPGTDVLAVAAAGITLVLWSSAFVGIRAAGDDFSPGALALGRLTVAAIVLSLFAVVRREPLPTRDLPHQGLSRSSGQSLKGCTLGRL